MTTTATKPLTNITNQSYVIQPRSESIVKINILNSPPNSCCEGIIPKMKILDEVFLCESLVKVNRDNTAITSILNITEKSVLIKNISIHVDYVNIENFEQLATLNPVSKVNTNNFQSTRLDNITKSLRIEHMNHEETKSIVKICHEFNDIFYIDGDKLTYTDAITHQIPTTYSIPINIKTYRYPEIHKEEVDNQIKKMLEQDIITPFNSSWNFPVWVVPNKLDASGQRKWRVVIDYRKL